MKKALVVMLVVGILLLPAMALAEGTEVTEATEEKTTESTETIEGMQIIQLSDPFEPEMVEAEIQKYFNLDTTYDVEDETTSIWTTIGFRTDTLDMSFTWEQTINPSLPGTATLSLNYWW